MSTDDKKDKTPRRPNAERAAETREKVINAAIQCIFDVGYEGTSISLVATRAGVSKGAAQYHFPSKAELMLAVADCCLRKHSAIRQKIYSQFPPSAARPKDAPDASWEVINHPTYTALIEIMMAARNSAELKKGIPSLIEFIAKERDSGEEAFCRDLNIEPNPLLKALIRTHVTVMRGIAVGLMFNPDYEQAREELSMMRQYERMMMEVIVKKYSKGTGNVVTDNGE